jgi:hypothetical protein
MTGHDETRNQKLGYTLSESLYLKSPIKKFFCFSFEKDVEAEPFNKLQRHL